MCGIAGVVALDGALAPALAAAIGPMTGALGHRGPDADGFFRSPGAALGHRRLAIIDVARGAQPMSNEDGTVWIVFNGEVYNHAPLRQRLIGLGHRFQTRSDTETIIHAYEEFGPACVEHLAGMFAFAIYDQKTGELFIARDRLGKKPLFYGVLDGERAQGVLRESGLEARAGSGAARNLSEPRVPAGAGDGVSSRQEARARPLAPPPHRCARDPEVLGSPAVRRFRGG
jgi:asparagine synthetase B (glutamine-hydrolysing)